MNKCKFNLRLPFTYISMYVRTYSVSIYICMNDKSMNILDEHSITTWLKFVFFYLYKSIKLKYMYVCIEQKQKKLKSWKTKRIKKKKPRENWVKKTE